MYKRLEVPELEILDELLSYDPETGKFIWKARASDARFTSRYAGAEAGNKHPDGYTKIFVAGKRYAASRLAWAMFHRQKPAIHLDIDHINRDRSDNRIENLRLVPPATNMRNTVSRTDLPKGVCFHVVKGKYMASIRWHVGYFDTAEDAGRAYDAIEALLVSHAAGDL